jgi:dihydroorotate dehydrogenase
MRPKLRRLQRRRAGRSSPAAAMWLLDSLYRVARPALFALNAEDAHWLVLKLSEWFSLAPQALPLLGGMLLPPLAQPVEAFGLGFRNRIGLAAGLDKNAIALHAWAALGFGHVAVGTVTPRPQDANPGPRLFRLREDKALINRLGFPNGGAVEVAKRLRPERRPSGLIVGGNIGKGRETPLEAASDDYRTAAETLGPVVDYLTINVSSPNTANLRQLQAPGQLADIVKEVRRVSGRPVLVKLSPDLADDALPEIVAAARQAGAVGLIAANTTTSRLALRYPSRDAYQAGGLSGAPIGAQVLRMTERLAQLAGNDLTIISVGGIFTPADVQDRLNAGATLVQICTSLVYEGPGLVARLLAAQPRALDRSATATAAPASPRT